MVPTADVPRRQYRVGNTFYFVGRYSDPLRLGRWRVTFEFQPLDTAMLDMSGPCLVSPDSGVLDGG